MITQTTYNFTNTLREHRKKHKLLQAQVAALLGFESTDRISHWEKGVAVPSIVNLARLCALYRVSFYDLYPALHEIAEDEIEGRKLEQLVG